jgi:hypothetical protein
VPKRVIAAQVQSKCGRNPDILEPPLGKKENIGVNVVHANTVMVFQAKIRQEHRKEETSKETKIDGSVGYATKVRIKQIHGPSVDCFRALLQRLRE